MFDRGFSVLEIKSISEDQRIIRGIASTPRPDRSRDIMEPLGVRFKTPLPLLLYHDNKMPVGTVNFAKPNKDGIPFEASIPKIDEPGILKDRVDEAWQSIKYKVLSAVSIGFIGLRDGVELLKNGGRHFKEWEWLELSLVTVPDQADAVVTAFKSAEFSGEQFRDTNAPRSAQTVVRLSSPGASGKSAGAPARTSPKPPEGKNVKNIQEQIKDFTNERAVKVAALDDILEKAEGATLEADAKAKYSDLEREVEAIDEHLETLKRAEARQKSTATPARATEPGEGGEAAAAAAAKARGARGDGVVATQPKIEKGIRFARFAGVLAHAKGNINDAMQFAKNRFPQDKVLHDVLGTVAAHGGDGESVLKAAVAAGTTSDSAWAGPLVQYRDMVEDFVDFLRPMTIIGKLPLRRAPFNIRIPRQLTGGSAFWTGEGQAKPVTSLTFDNITMKWFKLATIAVITQELARFSSPAAEGLIRDALAKAIAYQADLDFIDPDNAGTADVKPASILYGVTPIHASGTNEAALNADIASVFGPFITANMSPETGYWLMTPAQALKISLMKNTLGQRAFPGVGLNGGEFNGMPLITSNALNDAEGSAGGAPIVLIDAASIWLADDGEATIDVSTQASVQMDSAPDNPTTASTVMVSLWQRNEIGIRAERYINWLKARAQAAQWIDGANYH